MPSSNVFSGQGVIGKQITLIRSDSDGVSLKNVDFDKKAEDHGIEAAMGNGVLVNLTSQP